MTADYPEYAPNALFVCSQGCGTFARKDCGNARGRLICPWCRYAGTLRYEGGEHDR